MCNTHTIPGILKLFKSFCVCYKILFYSFDAENDFEAAQSMLNTLERSAFRDTVLDNLKETPMSMRERLGLRRY